MQWMAFSRETAATLPAYSISAPVREQKLLAQRCYSSDLRPHHAPSGRNSPNPATGQEHSGAMSKVFEQSVPDRHFEHVPVAICRVFRPSVSGFLEQPDIKLPNVINRLGLILSGLSGFYRRRGLRRKIGH